LFFCIYSDTLILSYAAKVQKCHQHYLSKQH
jgi:hypothetical protein